MPRDWFNEGSSEFRDFCGCSQGGFARVYELTDVDSGEIFAGKIVLKSSLTKSRAKQKAREIRQRTSQTSPLIFDPYTIS